MFSTHFNFRHQQNLVDNHSGWIQAAMQQITISEPMLHAQVMGQLPSLH